MRGIVAAAAGLYLLSCPDLAAHVIAPGTPLSVALHHPAFVPVHALAFIGAGLWAGRHPMRTGWAMVGALCLGVAIGIGLAALGWLPPWRSEIVFLALALPGIATAANWRPPIWAGAAAVGILGIIQGIVGGLPEFQGGTGHHRPEDVVVAALVLSILAHELARRATAAWAGIVVRIAGSWIAAAAILLLAFALRLRLGIAPA